MLRGSAASRNDLIGVLDVGTAKVCCVIAAREDAGLVLRGIGHQRSLGVKSGMVVDADEAERAIRAAVGQAERMAGVSLGGVVLGVNCGRLKSMSFAARAQVEGRVVGEGDIARIIAAGEAYLDRSGRSVIQVTRSDWRLDGAAGINDPRGMAGHELAVELQAVTADDGPIRNLLGVVERCHLAVERLVAAPYASALSVTEDDERRHGVLVVDMGAGLTSLAAFADGRLAHVDVIPVGGNHATYDVARTLVTTVAEAERIKTLYGTLVNAASNGGDSFTYPVAGEEAGALHQASKAFVREVLVPRFEGLLDLVEERLGEAGLADIAGRRVVLTGGASQLVGLDQAWSARFGGSVRIGRPQPIGRMPVNLCSAAFATVIGLLGVKALVPNEMRRGVPLGGSMREPRYLDRMQRWIRESF